MRDSGHRTRWGRRGASKLVTLPQSPRFAPNPRDQIRGMRGPRCSSRGRPSDRRQQPGERSRGGPSRSRLQTAAWRADGQPLPHLPRGCWRSAARASPVQADTPAPSDAAAGWRRLLNTRQSSPIRAKQGRWSRRRDACATTNAGRRRPSRASSNVAPLRLKGHARAVAASPRHQQPRRPRQGCPVSTTALAAMRVVASPPKAPFLGRNARRTPLSGGPAFSYRGA